MTLLPSFGRSAADGAGRIPRASLIAAAIALLPLAAMTAALWWRPLLISEATLAAASLGYGAALAATLSGLHWSLARRPPPVLAVTLAAPLAILLPVPLGLMALIAVFLLNGLAHVTAVERGRLPYRFGTLSSLLTAGAVVTLIAALLRLFA